MRGISLLVLAAILAITFTTGCGNDEKEGTQTPSPTATVSSDATSTPNPTITMLPKPTPVPGPVEEAWAARYKGQAGGADHALDMVIDGSGNVYVTGKSFSNKPYNYSYATVKYDNDGNELWVARYDGPGGDDDAAQAIAVDVSGNVYVTGKSYNGEHFDYAYATVKYDSEGNELWAARYDGPGEGDDIAVELVVDDSGNVYVTGSSSSDYATVKYDRDGNELWAIRYDGGPGSDDMATGLGIDGSGGVYVSGYSGMNYTTIKYDRDGNELWVARKKARGDEGDKATAMAVDSAGNVYVTGKSYNQKYFEYNYSTVKYDRDGNELWVAGCDGLSCGEGESMDISVDGELNVYITGRSFSHRSSVYGYTTIKYDSSGNQLWEGRYENPAISQGEVAFLAVDGAGNVYVTCRTEGYTDYDYAYATVKYSSSGNEEWVIKYEGPADGFDQPAAIAVDEEGNIYIAGRSDGGPSCADFATIKYVPRQ